MGCQCSNFDQACEGDMDLADRPTDTLKKQAEEYPLLVYSSKNCQRSAKAKDLLRQNLLNFEYFELEHMHDGGELAENLAAVTGTRKVPYIFLHGKYYGGLAELVRGIETGELAQEFKTVETL